MDIKKSDTKNKLIVSCAITLHTSPLEDAYSSLTYKIDLDIYNLKSSKIIIAHDLTNPNTIKYEGSFLDFLKELIDKKGNTYAESDLRYYELLGLYNLIGVIRDNADKFEFVNGTGGSNFNRHKPIIAIEKIHFNTVMEVIEEYGYNFVYNLPSYLKHEYNHKIFNDISLYIVTDNVYMFPFTWKSRTIAYTKTDWAKRVYDLIINS